MRDEDDIKSASDRASNMWDAAQSNGSKYRGMSYEDGLREAFDWIMENCDEDPTKPE